MHHIKLTVQVEDDFLEIILAELADTGFDSFVETPDGLEAYAEEAAYNATATKQLFEDYAARTPLSYTLEKIEKVNWNAEWEKNFQPIELGNDVRIRADFHDSEPGFTHEIVITPKMSFGTGHHETTSMMMELQLGLDHTAAAVLDVGTGTGILGILAAKLGATHVHGFDIEEWAVLNTEENVQMNHVAMSVKQGTIQDEMPALYNIVLANINRNILLDEIPVYQSFMKMGGYLLVSGFYDTDRLSIEEKAAEAGLQKVRHLNKNQWAAVVFQK